MTKETKETSGVDILSFDAVTPCETAQPLMMKTPTGKDTGITLFVLGEHADVVKKYLASNAKKVLAADFAAKKLGREEEFTNNMIDNRDETEVNGAAVRVTGWDGVAQSFDVKILKKALEKNPHWITDIVKYSGTIGNFTK